jgi:methylenetetrahydrofolate--tRNA-(uracil-5-)-methyltransferase
MPRRWRVFRSIPGLENAEFARLGGLHRNTFIQPQAAGRDAAPEGSAAHIRFAGQMTGCEGYVESAAIGLLAGALRRRRAVLGQTMPPPPLTTALGALLGHVTGGRMRRPSSPKISR